MCEGEIVGNVTHECRVPHWEFEEKDHDIKAKWATPPIINWF